MIITTILITQITAAGGFGNFTNQTNERLVCDPVSWN